MKVRELIEKLCKMPLDCDVMIDVEARTFDTHYVEAKGCYHEPEVSEMATWVVLTVQP